MEASGHARWLERLLKELQVELWCGNKRAIIATARKLSVLLHRLWVRGEVYEPLRNRQRAIAAAA
jgi:hypothetical protein